MVVDGRTIAVYRIRIFFILSLSLLDTTLSNEIRSENGLKKGKKDQRKMGNFSQIKLKGL